MDCAVTENTGEMFVEYRKLKLAQAPEIHLTYSEIQSLILKFEETCKEHMETQIITSICLLQVSPRQMMATNYLDEPLDVF